MRQQVNQDVSYNTYRPDGGKLVEAAFTAQSAGSELAEIDGEGYTVRQFGAPTYWIQESKRLEQVNSACYSILYSIAAIAYEDTVAPIATHMACMATYPGAAALSTMRAHCRRPRWT